MRDSIFCFVNAHFAANENEVARRNLDYLEICRRLTFGTPIVPSSNPGNIDLLKMPAWSAAAVKFANATLGAMESAILGAEYGYEESDSYTIFDSE